MTTIRQDDFIQSIADALQFISYYHPQSTTSRRWARRTSAEESPAAKDAIAQILTNSRMCAEGPPPDLPGHRHRRRVRQGRHGRAAGTARRCRSPTWSTRACAAPTSIPTTRCARRSSPIPPARARTRSDNTPAVVHFDLVPGDTVEVKIAAKGGGSENKSKFVDAESVRFDRRLGAEDRADDGRRLVPAGHARHRHRRHARKRRCCSRRKR